MKVEELVVAKQIAEKELVSLKEMFRRDAENKKQLIYQDMRKVYGHLRNGKAVIDLYESMKKVGLNEDGDPKLAIVRADAKQVFCTKEARGKAIFKMVDSWKYYKDEMIVLPEGLFTWLTIKRQWKDGIGTVHETEEVKNPKLKTIVPIIPARILVDEVKHQLHNYHLLWEVEHWQPVPPKDPILLKQLTPNLFGVLATWDLTPLERAIIRGRLL